MRPQLRQAIATRDALRRLQRDANVSAKQVSEAHRRYNYLVMELTETERRLLQWSGMQSK